MGGAEWRGDAKMAVLGIWRHNRNDRRLMATPDLRPFSETNALQLSSKVSFRDELNLMRSVSEKNSTPGVQGGVMYDTREKLGVTHFKKPGGVIQCLPRVNFLGKITLK